MASKVQNRFGFTSLWPPFADLSNASLSGHSGKSSPTGKDVSWTSTGQAKYLPRDIGCYGTGDSTIHLRRPKRSLNQQLHNPTRSREHRKPAWRTGRLRQPGSCRNIDP